MREDTPIPKDKTDRYLMMAAGVALTSEARMKHGAVVLRHGKVIAVACNKVKNDPRYVDWQHSSVHAEVAALRKAGWPRKATIYVARVNRHGVQRNSKPCLKCEKVLNEFNCKVYWTDDDCISQPRVQARPRRTDGEPEYSGAVL